MLHQIKAPQFDTNFLKLNIFSNAVAFPEYDFNVLNSIFISFQSLKTVGKSFRSLWKVLEFYTNLPV